ncbi:hypothetical protein B296_00015232, partial [Ensete ventricosum]
MDAVGVLARFPCVLSETPPLSRGKNGAAASHGRAHSLSFQSYRHLTAFQPSPFLSLSSSCRHAGTIRSRRTKTRIFLPHLVAAMVGEIISRFEKKGFLLKGLKLFQCPKELAEVRFLACFQLHDLHLNVVHGSDSPENGHREIGKLCNTFSK